MARRRISIAARFWLVLAVLVTAMGCMGAAALIGLDKLHVGTEAIEEWRRDSARRRAKADEILERFGPARRERSRDSTEAAFLRRTPERLIGPEA